MHNTTNKLLPSEAAKLLGIAVSTLARKRSTGGGCPYYIANGKVYYRLADIEAHIAKNTPLLPTTGAAQ